MSKMGGSNTYDCKKSVTVSHDKWTSQVIELVGLEGNIKFLPVTICPIGYR